MSETKVTYTTIKNEASAEFEEKRSLFIGHARPVKTEEEAAEFIKEKKKEDADATHNVFGYIIKNGICARYSDDGEPTGTAGLPSLEAIRKSGVNDVCVVVTRYFGGILLGAGGLVRAYSKSTSLALEAAGIVVYESFTELTFECSYSDYQKITPQISTENFRIKDTKYIDNVVIIGSIASSLSEDFIKKITEITSGRVEIEKISENFEY